MIDIFHSAKNSDLNPRRLDWFTWIVMIASLVLVFTLLRQKRHKGRGLSGLKLLAAACFASAVLALFGLRCPHFRLALAERGTAGEQMVPGRRCPKCQHELEAALFRT